MDKQPEFDDPRLNDIQHNWLQLSSYDLDKALKRDAGRDKLAVQINAARRNACSAVSERQVVCPISDLKCFDAESENENYEP